MLGPGLLDSKAARESALSVMRKGMRLETVTFRMSPIEQVEQPRPEEGEEDTVGSSKARSLSVSFFWRMASTSSGFHPP